MKRKILREDFHEENFNDAFLWIEKLREKKFG